jgi:hypothetical protein
MAFVQQSGSSTEARVSKGTFKAVESSKTLVKANQDRLALYVCNDSTATVYLALGATAAKSEGIRLNKEGGSVVIDNYSGEVTCFAAAAEAVLTFSEV